MNTFMPYPDFYRSAIVLDKKRCWKQVIEAKQIISILEKKEVFPSETFMWENHPAVQMWSGFVPLLKYYYDCFLEVCVVIHNINTRMEPYRLKQPLICPWWLGNEIFHRAMRAKLIEKDEEHYLRLFPQDKGFNDNKYAWPLMDGSRSFKTTN